MTNDVKGNPFRGATSNKLAHYIPTLLATSNKLAHYCIPTLLATSNKLAHYCIPTLLATSNKLAHYCIPTLLATSNKLAHYCIPTLLATSNKLAHYCIPTLLADKPDTCIIYIGRNSSRMDQPSIITKGIINLICHGVCQYDPPPPLPPSIFLIFSDRHKIWG